MTPSIRRIVGLASLALVGSTTASHAEPFINPSITASDPAITAWADALVDYAPELDPSPVGTELSALGPADNALVSLGDLDAAGVLLRGVMASGPVYADVFGQAVVHAQPDGCRHALAALSPGVVLGDECPPILLLLDFPSRRAAHRL